MKEKSFSKKLYHTSREIARGSFRRFTGGSPAFLSVWGGQTEREAPLCNLKLHAARFGVCVGLAAPLILAGYMYAVCALSRLTRGAEEVPFS